MEETAPTLSTFSDLSSSSLSSTATFASASGAATFKLAACRWKNLAACSYGRLRRTPKLPTRQLQSSESSSATEDMTEDEDSSSDSGEGEDAEEEVDYEMDSKDLCIEIKAKVNQVRNKDRSRFNNIGPNVRGRAFFSFSGLEVG